MDNKNIITITPNTDLNKVEHSVFPVRVQFYDLVDLMPQEGPIAPLYQINAAKDPEDDEFEIEFICPDRKAYFQLVADISRAITNEIYCKPNEYHPEHRIYQPGDDSTGDLNNAVELLNLLMEYDWQ